MTLFYPDYFPAMLNCRQQYVLSKHISIIHKLLISTQKILALITKSSNSEYTNFLKNYCISCSQRHTISHCHRRQQLVWALDTVYYFYPIRIKKIKTCQVIDQFI